jgi:predicted amidohydrolase YtcJ
LAGPQTKVVDLKGRTAIPGLIDTHIHIVSGGLGMVKVQLGEAESVADVLDILRNHIRDSSVPAGAWIVA